MKYNSDLETIEGRLAYLFNHNGYKLDKKKLYKAIRDMFKKGILEYNEVPKEKGESQDTYKQRIKDQREKDITNAYNQVTKHLNGKTIPSTDWIIRYIRFFECSADYILGFIRNPTHERTNVNKRTGLSDNAIKTLLSDSEIGLVCNSLLETNSIKDLVEYLEVTAKHESVNNYVLNTIYHDIQATDNKRLYGVTLDKYKEFQDTLEQGEDRLKETLAIVCLDRLCHDNNLLDHFKNKAYADAEKQMRSITSKGQK